MEKLQELVAKKESMRKDLNIIQALQDVLTSVSDSAPSEFKKGVLYAVEAIEEVVK